MFLVYFTPKIGRRAPISGPASTATPWSSPLRASMAWHFSPSALAARVTAACGIVLSPDVLEDHLLHGQAARSTQVQAGRSACRIVRRAISRIAMHLRQLQSEWMRQQPLSQEPNRSSALLSRGVPPRAGRRAGECWRAARRGGGSSGEERHRGRKQRISSLGEKAALASGGISGRIGGEWCRG